VRGPALTELTLDYLAQGDGNVVRTVVWRKEADGDALVMVTVHPPGWSFGIPADGCIPDPSRCVDQGLPDGSWLYGRRDDFNGGDFKSPLPSVGPNGPLVHNYVRMVRSDGSALILETWNSDPLAGVPTGRPPLLSVGDLAQLAADPDWYAG
jgi:hypothetical protein